MKKDFVFGKKNFLLVGLSILLIIIGFVLMSGGGSEDPYAFNEAIFSVRRIVVAPIVTLLGFGLMIFSILKK